MTLLIRQEQNKRKAVYVIAPICRLSLAFLPSREGDQQEPRKTKKKNRANPQKIRDLVISLMHAFEKQQAFPRLHNVNKRSVVHFKTIVVFCSYLITWHLLYVLVQWRTQEGPRDHAPSKLTKNLTESKHY